MPMENRIFLAKLNRLVNHFEISFYYITGFSDVKSCYPGSIDIDILKKRLEMMRKENKILQDEAARVTGDKQSTY